MRRNRPVAVAVAVAVAVDRCMTSLRAADAGVVLPGRGNDGAGDGQGAQDAGHRKSESAGERGETAITVSRRTTDVTDSPITHHPSHPPLYQYGALGDVFNPSVHEAMFQMPTTDAASHNTLGQIINHGYMYKTRVLRPCKAGVNISSAPPAAAEPAADATEEPAQE